MGKLLFDFFPILLFFVVFKFYDDQTEGIVAATGAAIIGSFIQVGYSRFKTGKVENMHLVTLALIVVLGGATIALRDETFIKWKPTVVNWLFALVFLGSQFIGKKNLVERMMDKAVTLPATAWRGLNFAWVVFFVAMGVINLYVVYNYDTDTWVNFKLFGMLGMTLVFVLAQSFFIMRYMKDDDAEDAP